MANKKSTRKDNGTGTIVQRSDGRYMGKIMMGYTPDGKPNCLYAYGKTEAEAKRKLKAKIQAYNDSRGIITESVSVKKWFTTWLENVMKPTLKPKSYEAKARCVEKFIIPKLGGIKVNEVTTEDIQGLINDLVKQGYSYSQIQKVYNTIGQRYRLAIQQQRATFNPTVGVHLPRQLKEKEDNTVTALTKDEAKLLIKRARETYENGTPIYPRGDLIVLLLQTGMRVGEALALQWSDINLEEKYISITKNLVTVKNEDKTKINPETKKPFATTTIIQDTPKTSHSNRKIPIGDSAIQTIKNIKVYNGKFDYVYANSKGKPTEYRTLERMFKLMLKNAGIENKYSLHSLRHTYASLLFAQGVSDRYISEVLGHSSLAITHKVYIHIINDLKTKEINRAMVEIKLDD